MVPTVTVHGVGTCSLDGNGLPYSSLGGITMSNGKFPSPVDGVDVLCDVVAETGGSS